MKTITSTDIKNIHGLVNFYEHCNNWQPISNTACNTNIKVKIEDTIVQFAVLYSSDSKKGAGSLPIRHLSIDKANSQMSLASFYELVLEIKEAYGFKEKALIFESCSSILHVVESLFD